MEVERAGADTGVGGVFRRLLVGFDGSNEARRALRVALDLAADLSGAVHVLLAIRPPAYVETPGELARAADSERQNLSRGLLGLGHNAEAETRLPIHVVFTDDPAQALARHAEEHGFDLIVVGGHGRERVSHGGIGHSLDELLRAHPCPVLVV